jgi:hypothetical protein
MIPPNMVQMQAMFQHMPDQALIQTMQNAPGQPANPGAQAAAMMELQRRKQMRDASTAQASQAAQQAQAAQKAQQQVPQQAQQATQQTLAKQQADKMAGGVGTLPAPNMAQMAGGGIVGFASGGSSQDEAPDNDDPSESDAAYFARMGAESSRPAPALDARGRPITMPSVPVSGAPLTSSHNFVDPIYGQSPATMTAEQLAHYNFGEGNTDMRPARITAPTSGSLAELQAYYASPAYTASQYTHTQGNIPVGPPAPTGGGGGGENKGAATSGVDPFSPESVALYMKGIRRAIPATGILDSAGDTGGFKPLGAQDIMSNALQLQQQLPFKNYLDPQQIKLDAQEARINDTAEKAPWLALAQAGFGMMSGTSPFAGVNIGQGGAMGLAALQKSKEFEQQQRTAILQSNAALAAAQDARQRGDFQTAEGAVNASQAMAEKAGEMRTQRATALLTAQAHLGAAQMTSQAQLGAMGLYHMAQTQTAAQGQVAKMLQDVGDKTDASTDKIMATRPDWMQGSPQQVEAIRRLIWEGEYKRLYAPVRDYLSQPGAYRTPYAYGGPNANTGAAPSGRLPYGPPGAAPGGVAPASGGQGYKRGGLTSLLK